MAEPLITHPEITEILERVADLLEAQDANRYRVRTYRSAAKTIQNHETPFFEILSAGGVEAIDALPTIGRTIADLEGEQRTTPHAIAEALGYRDGLSDAR